MPRSTERDGGSYAAKPVALATGRAALPRTLSPRVAAPLLDTRLGGGAFSPVREAVLTDEEAFATDDAAFGAEDALDAEDVLAAVDVLDVPFDAAELLLDTTLSSFSKFGIVYPFRA